MTGVVIGIKVQTPIPWLSKANENLCSLSQKSQIASTGRGTVYEDCSGNGRCWGGPYPG